MAQHGVGIDGVQQVLDDEAEFGVAFADQTAAEEEGVGVFAAGEQQQEIAGGGADGEIGRAAVGCESVRGDGAIKGVSVDLLLCDYDVCGIAQME